MHATMTPDEIWAENKELGRQGDLFGRREEAEQLIAYIESVVGRRPYREDKRAFTIAVDAPYGEGKSFFLRRLAEHLRINHPVAYIDAWADDLADEPLTALAATLKIALEPYADKPDVQARLANFMSKTGRVAKIVGWGLFRRGLGMVITGKAVDEAEEALSAVSEDVKATLEDGLKEVGKGTVDDATEGLKGVSARALMETRVAAFEEGKQAVQNLKDSLSAIVEALESNEHHPPIVIVIDELDRCRPTYAVKLLEEIKHLFDVPGLVFVLALHGEQLGHSVAGAYGAGFDGRAYLKRFIDRVYHLSRPGLTPLLERLCGNAGLTISDFQLPGMAISQTQDLKPTLPQLLAKYMKVYGLNARDAFELVDILQTSNAIVGRQLLHLPYFLPLVIGHIKGVPTGGLPEPLVTTDWVYVPNWHRGNGDATEASFSELASSIQEKMRWSDEQVTNARAEGRQDYAIRIVSNSKVGPDGEVPLGSLDGYPRLLGTVARFTNPRIDEIREV